MRSPARIFIIASVVLILAGCGGGSREGEVFVPGQGHPEAWVRPLSIGNVNFHGTAVKKALDGPAGSALFLLHCAACHGEDARGKIGPDVRGVPVSFITAAIQVLPIMKGHSVLTQDEQEEIAAYLALLADNLDPVQAAIHTNLCMECHGRDLDGGISRISCFACHGGPRGDVGHPAGWSTAKDDPVHFHGKYGAEFIIACTNCHGLDLKGGIGPRCESCHDGISAPVLATAP